MLTQATSYPHWTQVYGEGAGEYPRVYRDQVGQVRVYLDEHGDGRHFSPVGGDWGATLIAARGAARCTSYTLLTGPEAAEYIAAAREGRDAVWPPRPKQTHHDVDQYYPKEEPFRVGDRVRFSDGREAVVTAVHPPHDEMKYGVRLDNGATDEWYQRELEYAAINPAPLPTPEEVAALHRKIAQMEGHLRWIAYEPIGPANNTAEGILDEITNTTRALICELAKPECRVKHDWTGAMGTVLMEHGGTSFVKWDDGQVTSVYNRHLQKELV